MKIRAIVFDLDGVLVQTEKLKALAYARAVQRIRGLPEPDFRASDAYREVIGAPRETTSRHVMKTLGLEDELRALMPRYRVTDPVDVLTAVRYEIYYEMVGDPQVIRDNQWPYTVDVLRVARQHSCKTGLATLSKRKDVEHVVRALGLEDELDVIVTADDVTRGKPDPEIYLTAATKLGVLPEECIVLEDSVNGVTAALSAGTNVVAVATPFTRDSLIQSHIVEDRWIVISPELVGEVVNRRILDYETDAGKNNALL